MKKEKKGKELVVDDVGIFTETVEVAQTTGKTHVIDRSPFFFCGTVRSGDGSEKREKCASGEGERKANWDFLSTF